MVDLVMIASGEQELGAGSREQKTESLPRWFQKLTKRGRRLAPRPQLLAPDSLAPDFLAPSLHGIDGHLLPVLIPELEFDHTVDQGEQRVIVGPPNVPAGVELGAALAHQDVPRNDLLAPVALNTEILRIAGPAIPAGAYAFLMCHCFL